ncbi:GNAT family N-acetyltransferase [Candidatus Woesearchaeota archaeon]|nr:GNAT family N-acetyltransferase [Candidatus Woesearchaeota archaeon]
MNFEIITNITECEKLWNTFSPHQNLWDEWNYVSALYDEENNQLHFIVIKDNADPNHNVGLLPLVYKKEENLYRRFDGEYGEDYTFWLDPITLLKVIESLPADIKLFDINAQAATQALDTAPALSQYLKEDDFHYFIDLEQYNHQIAQYLQTFSKKHRKNLLYDLRKLEEMQYVLSWEPFNPHHYKLFTDLNIARFQEESDFTNQRFADLFKKFLSNFDQKKLLHTLVITLNNQVIAIEYAALYKGTYYVLNGGYDPKIENIGKLLIFEHLKRAMNLKANRIDFLAGDSGWKKLWNCQSEPYYALYRKRA